MLSLYLISLKKKRRGFFSEGENGRRKKSVESPSEKWLENIWIEQLPVWRMRSTSSVSSPDTHPRHFETYTYPWYCYPVEKPERKFLPSLSKKVYDVSLEASRTFLSSSSAWWFSDVEWRYAFFWKKTQGVTFMMRQFFTCKS